MTRSDVFTSLSKPLLWSVHMLPIYRKLDGVKTKEKNLEVFIECSKVLKNKRNILVFAEGFTDDIFVRRLKPIKKGAIRIGFSTLEYLNWSEKIYVSAIGCNYTEPNQMRSDLLISTSDSICLNDYREEYLLNPNKVITQLTLLVEKLMQNQITHIQNPHLTSLHEWLMILTRKGMNSICYKDELSLKDRFEYSKKLANWINQEPVDRLHPLKEVTEKYFNSLSQLKITDNDILDSKNKRLKLGRKLLNILLLLPISVPGLIHCALPYIIVKYFVEKKFKRAVFWGSTKMLLSTCLIGLVNIPYIFLFDDFFQLPNWTGFIYYLLIGIFGLAFYISLTTIKDVIRMLKLERKNLNELFNKRETLISLMKNTIPSELL